MRKKGVSPVVSTILLVVLVVALALIIFLWARGFVKEAVTKESKPIEQVCQEVSLKTDYLRDKLQLVNSGNVPVKSLEIRKISSNKIERIASETSLPVGSSAEISVGEGYEKIEVYPVVLGERGSSKTLYVCKNPFLAE